MFCCVSSLFLYLYLFRVKMHCSRSSLDLQRAAHCCLRVRRRCRQHSTVEGSGGGRADPSSEPPPFQCASGRRRRRLRSRACQKGGVTGQERSRSRSERAVCVCLALSCCVEPGAWRCWRQRKSFARKIVNFLQSRVKTTLRMGRSAAAIDLVN